MKTKELIERLKEADPEGDSEVVVGGDPIYFCEKLPGYYDGAYSVLIQDHDLDPYYNIKGIKITRQDCKVKLHIMGMDDVLLDDPEAIVELDPSLASFQISDLTDLIEKRRQEYRDLKDEVKKNGNKS